MFTVEARHGIIEDDEVRRVAADLMHEQNEREGVAFAEAEVAASSF
jgi:hypothetical protein